jgi:hypothetical protein
MSNSFNASSKTSAAELGKIRLSEVDLDEMLARVADLAKASISQAVAASVTLIRDGQPDTPAFTDDVALALDETQYDAAHGPCLDAAKDQTWFAINDMATETRWPAFTRAALDHGVHGSLSIGLPIDTGITGAINIYLRAVGLLDDGVVELGRAFAEYAAVALANVNLHAVTAALATQMAEAMASRALIEQAKGILIAEQHVDADAAFAILARASQSSNRKLRDIAEALVANTSNQGEAATPPQKPLLTAEA